MPKWLDGGFTPLCFVFEMLKGLRAYIFIFIEVYVYVYVYATCGGGVYAGQKRVSRSPGTEVRGSCEPLNISVGNQT